MPPSDADKLQWGRAQLSAETAIQRDSELAWRPASMGPRSIERGNLALPLSVCVSLSLLQWGRAQLSAETGWAHSSPFGVERLQWGRAQLSAETRASMTPRTASLSGFNGAALN